MSSLPPLRPPQDPEFRAFLAYSAEIGRDRLLVQGPGGNTSFKEDGVLWVKASGTWLREAESRPIMIPLTLDPLREAVRTGDPRAETALDFVLPHDGPALRPSVEATLHAALPQRVVIHVHCVETLAWAVRADAEAALTPRLAGLDWRFLPYVRPGPPLTRSLLALSIRGAPDIVVLGQHGLVVAGATVEEASARLGEVRKRLARPVRPAPVADEARLARLAAETPYRPGPAEAQHLALDPASLALARRGSLYPDHVVFLGAGLVTCSAASLARQSAPMVVAPDEGVFIRRDAPPAVEALTLGLADVTARLDPAEPVIPLDAAAEAELLGWEAEHYRKRLASS
jgi:rhamnose utilization protein RhaD (predicted bifunctional aldolase and dehydrogenase)